jgi:hypothetical protein
VTTASQKSARICHAAAASRAVKNQWSAKVLGRQMAAAPIIASLLVRAIQSAHENVRWVPCDTEVGLKRRSGSPRASGSRRDRTAIANLARRYRLAN